MDNIFALTFSFLIVRDIFSAYYKPSARILRSCKAVFIVYFRPLDDTADNKGEIVRFFQLCRHIIGRGHIHKLLSVLGNDIFVSKPYCVFGVFHYNTRKVADICICFIDLHLVFVNIDIVHSFVLSQNDIENSVCLGGSFAIENFSVDIGGNISKKKEIIGIFRRVVNADKARYSSACDKWSSHKALYSLSLEYAVAFGVCVAVVVK